jgi:hypothetical protein
VRVDHGLSDVADLDIPLVTAPCTANRHINFFGHLIPGHASVTELQDLVCRGGMSRSSAAAHDDAGAAKAAPRARIVVTGYRRRYESLLVAVQ